MLNLQTATLVVDISHYDSVISWDKVKASKVAGVICKATEGPGLVDITFERRVTQARKAQLLLGAYHFLRKGSVDQQVQHFLSVAKPNKDMLLALDHEDQDVPLQNAMEFCERVESLVGRFPILYSGFLIKEQLAHVPAETARAFAKDVRLWLAEYGQTPKWPSAWDKPFLWQFTGDGQGESPHGIPGIVTGGKGIDISAFDGSPAELEKAWA